MAKQKKAKATPDNVMNIPRGLTPTTFGRFSIEHYLDWTYSSIRMFNGQLHPDFIGDTDKRLIRTFTEFICKTYMMTDMPTYHTDIKEVIGDTRLLCSADDYRKQIARRLKRLMKDLHRSNISCRLVGEQTSFVMIAYLENNVLTIVSSTFDNIYTMCKCCYDTETDASGELMLERAYNSPFFLSKKARVAEVLLNRNDDIHTTDLETLRLIGECVRCVKEETSELTLSQSNCEMYFIRKMLKSMSLPYWPMDIKNWISPGSDDYHNDNFAKTTLDVVNIVTNCNFEQYPLIDVGEKELKFIMKYAITNRILGGADDEDVDLLSYISHVPYGDTFRLPVESDGCSGEVIGTFILDEETSDLRMILIHNIPEEDIVVFSTIDYENVKEFNHVRCCRDCNTTLLCKQVDRLPSNLDVLNNGIPKIFLDSESIDKIISSFIALYVILHDRPSRNRMVSCSRRISKQEKQSKRKSNKKEECEYVVTRILKTAQAAKKYVADMTASGQVDREYTLESWPRKGYYRRVRGGVIWIPPTTCHRHLELSEKEIHIKL